MFKYNGVRWCPRIGFALYTFFEIEVLLKGSAKTITDNTELQLSGGDCVFCMPGSVQKINLFNDATVVTMRFWELIGSMRLNAIGKTENPKRYLKTKKRRFYDPGTPWNRACPNAAL